MLQKNYLHMNKPDRTVCQHKNAKLVSHTQKVNFTVVDNVNFETSDSSNLTCCRVNIMCRMDSLNVLSQLLC